MKKLLVINDNSAHPNWGAQATVYALRKMLENALPDTEIRYLSWSRLREEYRVGRWPGGRNLYFRQREGLWAKVVNRVTTFQRVSPEIFDDFEYFADVWLAGQGGPLADDFLADARWADVVVYNGENSLYRNTPEGCRALFMLWLAKVRLGKPAAIINFTAHLTGVRPYMNAMVTHVLPLLDLVTGREPRGVQNVRQLGIRNIQLVPDVVFSLKAEDYSDDALRRWASFRDLARQPYFCFSTSGMRASEPRDGYDGAVTELVREIKGQTGCQAVLVARDPHCQFLADVARRSGSLFFGPDHECTDLFPLFRSARCLVSGHYHYVIMAAMSGCPFVPLSAFNHKMEGECEHLQWRRRVPFDITDLRTQMPDILAEVQAIMRQRDDLAVELRQRAAELHEQSFENAERVKGLFG